jgi:ferredoxin
MRLTIDTETCQGHGRCYFFAPEVFGCDDQGHSFLLHDEVDDEHRDQAQHAVLGCPERAIHVAGE